MNGLLNALIAYWPGNEASGDLLDAHTNDLDLTDTNTVTNATGKVYATARQYTVANSEYHTKTDDTYLSVGDTDFTIAAWVYFDSFSKKPAIVTKVTAGAYEYDLSVSIVSNRFYLAVHDGTTTLVGNAVANSFGAPSTSTWYLVVAWHDSVNNTVNIQINNGDVDSVDTTGTPGDTSAAFCIGARGGAPTTDHMAGRIGPTMFWKSAAGGGGVLSTAQRTALYNSGNGLTYAAFTT
jgi:hypothetical protein